MLFSWCNSVLVTHTSCPQRPQRRRHHHQRRRTSELLTECQMVEKIVLIYARDSPKRWSSSTPCGSPSSGHYWCCCCCCCGCWRCCCCILRSCRWGPKRNSTRRNLEKA
ncbi:uncharacterized protein LOC125537100 isoform X2 [Triticum urartu]|uniref:uncharacterized protein LOC125537100 isoform X2 n=1 Tax=Triticum urartu TaxID=4572 RepID=UPI002043C315|nr:uncharacterized protein LOC125537100 isoform X2 [Triticum urartu]